MATLIQKEYSLALVGAGGAVGREFLKILEERSFPIREIRLFGSAKSAGKNVEFRGDQIPIKELTPSCFEGLELAFFTAGSPVSREFAPIAAKSGCVVVDNTSAFRMDPDVPLSVPEVNPETLQGLPARRIFSVPNCATVQLVVALAPLHRKARIRRIVLSTYQSTSGAGNKAMEELSKQVTDLYSYREITPKVFPHQIAFSVIPQIDRFLEDGSTFEEQKICEETRKILGDKEIGISATAVRVPTFHGHAESVNVELEKDLTLEEARALLHKAPGVILADDGEEDRYPILTECVGQDDVCVGRLRKDASRANCLNLWIVADNLRIGAALNGIQIFEALIQNDVL